MALTKKQLKEVTDSIKKRMLRFRYEALGERALSEEEILFLQEAGLLRRGVVHMTEDPAILGKVIASLPASSRSIRFDDLMDLVARQQVELTSVEQAAVDFATEHAGEYIKGIEDMAIRTARLSSSRASMDALKLVQDGVKESLVKRQTISQLKTDLFDMLDDRYRDWQRVAHTEMNNAIQAGVYKEIRDSSESGTSQLVYKLPSPDACKHCKRLYLESDQITPKIFKLEDLAESNVGLKVVDWQPTVGSIHPYCHCQLFKLPKGMGFETKTTATSTIEHEGESLKTGSIIPDNIYSELSEDEKLKTRKQAILTFKEPAALKEE